MDMNPMTSSRRDPENEEFSCSDLDFEKIETEVPVPDRLHKKSFSGILVNSLKLSQKIGLLLWMNKNGSLSSGGKERLLYLQRKASEEAIIAGLKFSSRLTVEKKLQSDFKPHMVELNRRPQSRRFRVSEKRRIGVGYRDKGTLPDLNSRSRNRAQEDSFVFQGDLPEELVELIKVLIPTSLEGEWIDLEEIGRKVSAIPPKEQSLLLNQL